MADKKAIIDETQFEAQYDAEAKLLLAQKPFLANILVRTVKDYMGLNPCDVEKLIEGEHRSSQDLQIQCRLRG